MSVKIYDYFIFRLGGGIRGRLVVYVAPTIICRTVDVGFFCLVCSISLPLYKKVMLIVVIQCRC